MTLISLIGQDVTSGVGRNGKDSFGVSPKIGFREGNKDRRRRTGAIAEREHLDVPHGTGQRSWTLILLCSKGLGEDTEHRCD